MGEASPSVFVCLAVDEPPSAAARFPHATIELVAGHPRATRRALLPAWKVTPSSSAQAVQCQNHLVRMYLSSFRMGDHPEHLVSLIEPGRGAAVVANAMDAAPEEEREAGVQRELSALAELGIEAAELDLRAYVGHSQRLAADLRRYGLLWVRGGNVFMLRYSLAASGADDRLLALLAEDAFVYGGYSAGPCVLGPTLRGFEIVDDPAAVPAIHGSPPVWEGVGVLDYVLVPHVDSPDHPESERCAAVAAQLRREGVPHRTLRDGQAIVINGSEVSVR